MTQWTIDPSHSSATFSAKHMMISTVRGTMRGITGTLSFDPNNIAAASIEATIPAHNFDTGAADRDTHLKSGDFLDIENHPTMTFTSTSVEATGDDTAKIYGNLTIRNVTKPVVLDAEFLGTSTPPWGGAQVIGFHATTRINREDWALTWNVALETGGLLVGKDVKIEIDLEATPAAVEGAGATEGTVTA